MKNKVAIVLLSGGMDSALCAALAIEMGYEVAALHLNYGQKTQERELKAFNEICDYYGINQRLVTDISYLVQIGGSSLTDKTIEVEKANLDNKEIPSSYVPFRNGNILAIATSWAEVINADALVVGAMEQDSSGYPDCRREFFDYFESAINSGTKPETYIKIISPIIAHSKKDIVADSMEKKVPIHLTWSCYKSSDKACGECDSCGLRLRGFSQAGFEDPLEYIVKPNY